MLNAEERARFEKLNIASGISAVLITIVSAVTRRGFLDTLLLVALPFWIFIGARLAIRLYERPAAPWKEIPPAFATEHPLYGVGGWAYLVVVSLSLGSLLGGAYMAAVYFHDFRASFVHAALRSRANLPAAELYRAADLILWHEPLTYYMLALSAMTALSGWFILWLLLRRSRWFRPAFVALTFTSYAAALTPIAYLSLRFWQVPNLPTAKTATDLAIASLLSLAWLAYVYRSRRINVTTLSRVRRDDPILEKVGVFIQDGKERRFSPQYLR